MADGEEGKSEKISLRAERNGIGALLSSLRGDNLADEMRDMKTESSQSEPEVEMPSRPMNRREKRKLQQEMRKQEGEHEENSDAKNPKTVESVPPASIPTSLKLLCCDETSFGGYQAKFGYAATRDNNYVQMAVLNDTASMAASASQDRHFRVFGINDGNLTMTYKRNMAGLIMDMLWHGNERFFISSKGRPIQLFDTSTHEHVGNYRGKDSGDNVVEAYCIGETEGKLIGGYRNRFQLWDTEVTGEAVGYIKLFNSEYSTGITGLPMSIDIHPTMPDLFVATGSSSRAAIYSLKWSSNVSTIEGSDRGYTNIKFSPDGVKLYASERTGDIHCFDTRMNMLTQVLKRDMRSAHRTRFDIDPSGRLLFTGTSSGDVVVYDLHEFNEEISPVFTSTVASTCVPCVSVKNNKLLVCSGQRIYPDCPLLVDDSEQEVETQMEQRPRNSVQLFDIFC